MVVRALIVAVQKYPKSAELAAELPGTNEAAAAFCQWLADKKGVYRKGSAGYNKGAFFCCAGEEVSFRTHGTSRDQIIQALDELEQAAKTDLNNGTAATDELYCFFSGHGLCYPKTEAVQDDLFIASDFTKMERSGGACLKLRELIELLRPALGPGAHYYFFDACRTEVTFGRITPIGIGMVFKRWPSEYPGQAVLFSVAQGLAARTDSGFAKHLVDGLSGKGRAKGWYRNDLYVKFDFLREYLNTVTKTTVEADAGSGDGLILKVDPVPKEPCVIKVQGALPSDHFAFTVKQRNNLVKSGEFVGDEYQLEVNEPGDYQVEVRHVDSQPADVVRVSPPADKQVDLYDPAEVEFCKVPVGPVPMAPSAEGTLLIQGARNASIRVRDVQSIVKDSEVFNTESLSRSLPPGDYVVEVEESGHVVGRETVSVRGGETVQADPLSGPSSPLRDGLLQFFPREGHAVDFSESLGGATTDRDLGLWLALIGASRVVGRDGGMDFEKLGRVPLTAKFDAIPPGRAALFVLAGFESRSGPYAVGVGNPTWAEMTPVKGVPGLHEFSLEVEPGPKLLTFQMMGAAPVTISTYALANRATLLVLSDGGPRAPVNHYQLLLPIQALLRFLPQEVRWEIGGILPLQTTRFIVTMERLFARDFSVNRAFNSEEGAVDAVSRQQYAELIDAKWLDPIASLIAANDLLRRGVLHGDRPDLAGFKRAFPVMVAKLRKFFGEIPDVVVLDKAIGDPSKPPAAPPILADSLTAFNLDEQKAFMPFSNDLRHFSTPWVTWVGAVKPFYRGQAAKPRRVRPKPGRSRRRPS
jgi:hypothetical protein